jgi:hypothetical protein
MKTLKFKQFLNEGVFDSPEEEKIKTRLGELGLRPKREIDIDDPTSWQGLHSNCCGAQFNLNYGVCSDCGDFATPEEAEDDYEGDVYESEDDTGKIEDRLRDLGLAPKEEFDDRWNNMVDEWGSDPEISRAIDVLKSRTTAIMNKYIDYSDPEDETNYDQRREWIWEQSIDDIGFLEFMIAQGDI